VKGGLITSFNIYIFHVKRFTSKRTEEGETSEICFGLVVLCEAKKTL
jgi:hypothetical protein